MSALSEARRGSRTLSHLRWFSQARPGDYLLVAARMSAGLPVIGRHIEPLGGFLALGLFAPGFAPSLLANTTRPPLPVGAEQRRLDKHSATVAAVKTGLADVASAVDTWPAPTSTAPAFEASGQRSRVHRSSVPYGDQPGQVLDVWRRDDTGPGAPVLVYVPGGAWVFGRRQLQGHALMSHLADMGWVCVSMEYRTSPKHRWPRQIIDVKTAIAWTRANIDEFGGDPDFIAVAGSSAGGHLATLAGLTPGDAATEYELPDGADTSVDAVVSIYGSYDWEDRSTRERAAFMSFLERVVVQRRQASRAETFRAASPRAQLHADAPPFLVVHGAKDFLIPASEAETFADELRAVSRSRVAYVEVPGATHGFDLIDGARTGPVVNAIGLFLNHVYGERLTRRDERAV